MPESYFPLDINFFDHPKVVGLNDKATRLYLSSVAYANRLMTDGFIADAIAGRLVEWDMNDPDAVTPEGCAHELDRAILWHRADVPCPRGHDLTCPKMDIGAGWRVHDFLDHNRSRAYRMGERGKERDRKAAYRERQREAHRDSRPGVPPGHVPSEEDMSRLTTQKKRTQKNRRSKPLSVVPTDDDLALAATEVWETWKASTGKLRAQLDDNRRRAILAALKAYPRQDVLDAVQGWVNDPWPERVQHNDIVQLLWMGSRRKPHNVLEKMRDLWRDGPPVTRGRRTREMAENAHGLRALVEGLEGGEHGADPRMGTSRRPDQRQLPGPAG